MLRTISFNHKQNGEISKLESEIADHTWGSSAEAERNEAIENGNEEYNSFLDKDANYYFDQHNNFEFSGPYTNSAFTSINENDLLYLNEDNLSLMDAYKRNTENANIYFTINNILIIL